MTDQDELARLEAHLKALESAWGEFEHQARRYGDARERAGGILRDIDPDVRQLYRNLDDNEREQARVKAEIERLRAKTEDET